MRVCVKFIFTYYSIAPAFTDKYRPIKCINSGGAGGRDKQTGEISESEKNNDKWRDLKRR